MTALPYEHRVEYTIARLNIPNETQHANEIIAAFGALAKRIETIVKRDAGHGQTQTRTSPTEQGHS